MSFDDIQNFPVLRSAYGGLTKSERRIADYLAMNSETIRDLTVSDIAVATQSSEITVHRFCKKLGCTGLKELKFQLAPSISAGTDLFRDIEADDTTGMVAGKLFKMMLSTRRVASSKQVGGFISTASVILLRCAAILRFVSFALVFLFSTVLIPICK